MEGGRRPLGCKQQGRSLQLRPRRHRRGHVRTSHGHDPGRFLATGGNHRLAGFEADAAAVVADGERVGGQVAVRDVLGEPAAQLIVGNGDHLDGPGFSATADTPVPFVRARPPLYMMKYVAGTTPQRFVGNEEAIAVARKWAGWRARTS
jgi:hypothetical protein